ncbi:hypothetical protein Q3A86_29205 [Streptomyces sp. NBUA17]|uniref:hypothetical protein n=1 Tax=Streptomyces sp. NBUA17 TaxID=3062275 RepID=UPI0037D9ACB1
MFSKNSGPPGPAAVLCGPAGWVPPRVVTNDDLAVRLDTDDPGLPRERCVTSLDAVGPAEAPQPKRTPA